MTELKAELLFTMDSKEQKNEMATKNIDEGRRIEVGFDTMLQWYLMI